MGRSMALIGRANCGDAGGEVAIFKCGYGRAVVLGVVRRAQCRRSRAYACGWWCYERVACSVRLAEKRQIGRQVAPVGIRVRRGEGSRGAG